MKALILAAAVASFFAACCAELQEETTVNDECSSGCNSKLKLKISASGLGTSPDTARIDCEDKCLDGTTAADRQRICAKPCDLPIVLFDEQRGGSAESRQFCQLCNGNIGAAAQLCRETIDQLIDICQTGCCRSTPFAIPGGQWLAFASSTVTNEFPGICSSP